MRELRFFSGMLAEKFGHPMQRIPFDLGLSCPHRNKHGGGGCAFCAEDGSRARHLQGAVLTLEEQCRTGIEYAQRRYHAQAPYIAYFQAYTSTNAPAEELRKLFGKVMSLADFKVMIIATRPDCLPEETLDLLEEWSRKTELWIELGVQSACDETLLRINRGHDFACTCDAVRKLHARGIHTAAHVILGLPGETRETMMQTADQLAALPFEAVKIHNLLVLKNTKLAKMECTPLNEYEYASLLRDFIHRLPEHMYLMRLSAEADEAQIAAPKWWMKKSQFLEFFQDYFKSGTDSRFLPCRTGDGTYTLYHPAYKQHFHSVAGAYEESFKKYLEPLELRKKLEDGQVLRVLDVGFGLGFNAGAAIHTANEVKNGRLHLVSLENDPNVLKAALALPGHHAPDLLKALLETGTYRSGFAEDTILFGDAREILAQYEGTFDAVFLDGFSPDSNPELWTADFIRLLVSRLKPGGGIAAYSSAFPVLGAFLELGLDIRITEPFGRKRPSIAAFLPPAESGLAPLGEKDRNICLLSTAGIPYRDPSLKSTREEIFAVRTEEVREKRAAGMPKWYTPSQNKGYLY